MRLLRERGIHIFWGMLIWGFTWGVVNANGEKVLPCRYKIGEIALVRKQE
jgi:hypothetical protein